MFFQQSCSSAARVLQVFSKNCLPASLFKKGLSENLLRKGFIENYKSIFKFKVLSRNPIGVINRRNGCSPTIALKKAD